jgi:hypothetical protein
MSAPEHEVDELLLHLRGLVFVRAILEQRGASEAALAEHATEISRVRAALARTARASCCDEAA